MKKTVEKNIEDIIALTPTQEGMLFHYLKNPGGTQYSEQLCLNISGEIDIRWFEKAWDVVTKTNEMLRTQFRWEKLEKPAQIILKEHKCDLHIYDLTDNNNRQSQAALEEIKTRDRQKTLDLTRVPFRVSLCRIAGNKYRLIISNHHILYDGWSTGIILREFFNAYHALSSGNQPVNPLAKPSFKEFIRWRQSQDKTNQERFWKEYLTGFDNPTALPIKKRKKEAGEIKGSGRCTVSLPGSIKNRLEIFLKQHRATMASFFYSTWGILLQRYCNTDEVIFGTTVSGRSAPIKSLQDMVGLFINTIPLRIRTGVGENIKDLLCRVNDSLSIRENYESTPLVDIKEYSQVASQVDLFDSLVVMENYPLDQSLMKKYSRLPLVVDSYSIVESTHYDLCISITIGEVIGINFIYNPLSLEESSISGLSSHFNNIIEYILINPGNEIFQIEMLPAEEKKQVLYDFNDTETAYPQDKTIHGIFAEQAEKTPDHIALLCSEGTRGLAPLRLAPLQLAPLLTPISITYRELNEKSYQLAQKLKAKGVTADTIVGLMLERSPEMIISIMGILKAGGAYLPLDPEYPEQRIISMLEHSRSSLILTRGSIMEKKPLPPGGLALGVVGIEEMEELIKEPASLPAEDMEPSSGPGNLIYVIFTSGSTGIPKGAGVYHRGFVNLLHWFVTEFALNPQDRNLLLTSLSFDLTQKNLYASLITGGTLCVPGVGYFDPRSLVKQTREQEVTWINCTPSMFYQIVEYEETYNYEGLSSLRCVFLGGEPIAMSFLLPWLESGTCRAEIVNTYGPTECTDICNFYRVKEPRRFLKEPVPLGKPVYNVRLYIVDRHLQLTPVGVAGELTIAGAGVGKGYINDKDLTARKFTTHSFTPAHPPQLLYKTGDLVKWQPDGNMVFLGRIDHQVKVRGFRIEIGEIERWLSAYENVSEAVVLSREDGAGSNYLCGYVVLTPGGKLDSKALKTYLSQALPNYMIPSFFVQLEKIPLTANGKVDRKALPVPTVSPGRDYAPPQNEIEVTLAGIWSELLGLDKGTVGIHDDFFQLGGHSLKAAVLAAKIHKALNVKIPLADIFKSPTIRDLSQYINAKEKEQYISIEAAEQKEYYPLSSVQKRLYLLYQADRNSTAYNMPGIMILFGKTDRGKLEDTFKQLIVRHENFHTSFRQIKGEPVQLVHDHVELETTDYTDYKDEKKDTKNKEGQSEVFGSTFFQKGGPPEAVIKNFIRPFDLSRAPLLRVSLEPLETGKYLLMTDMHHIVSDGLSMGIMVREFMALLDGEKLPPLALQYKDFSEWWNRERKKENIRQQEAFWVKSLAGNPPVLRLPYDHPRPGERDYEGDVVEFTLDQEQTAALNHLAKEEGVTLFMLLLALFYVFLARLSGQEDILVGTPTVGRHQEELNRTMGMFVNTLVLRNFPQGSRTFKEFLQKLKERTLNAFANQDYPFEEVVELVASHWDKTRNPLFDVMFALQNLDIPAISIPGLTLEPYPYEHHISKFDLDLVGIENNGILAFTMEYRTALFKKSTIQRFIDYFKDITRVVLENKTVQLNNIEIKVFLEVAETSAAELTEAREAFEF